MKRAFFYAVIFSMILFIGHSLAFAEPSSKATAQFRDLTGVTLGAGWTTVFKQFIKTPTAKDLFISTSFEVGMTTNTAVMSNPSATMVGKP